MSDVCAIRDHRHRIQIVIVHLGAHLRLQVQRPPHLPFVSLWRCDEWGIRCAWPHKAVIHGR